MPLISIIVTLFVTLNPIGNIPAFVGLLREFDPKRQQRIIFREMVFVLLIMLLFGFVGDAILDGLHINLSVVRIAGGIILFFISLNMVFPSTSAEDAMQQEPFLVPLAIPIVAGPASISTVMVFANQIQNNVEMIVAILLAWIPAVAILLCSSMLKRVLGEKGLHALERLAGMILIFISVQMVAVGARDYVKTLGVF